MQKILIGAVVGGILIFFWQFLSWTVLDLHRPAQQYTPKQEEILGYLRNQIDKEGTYFLPNYPDGASARDRDSLMRAAARKPWAIISFHEAQNDNMTMNILRGLFVNILMVGLFCWIASRLNPRHFSTIFIAGLFVGLIVFINIPYTSHIWYATHDLMAYFVDCMIAWGLAGIWVGWLYTRRHTA
jgi:hypothetical protein